MRGNSRSDCGKLMDLSGKKIGDVKENFVLEESNG